MPGAPQLDWKALAWVAGVTFLANLAGWWTVTRAQIEPVKQEVAHVVLESKAADTVLHQRVSLVQERVEANKELLYAIREQQAEIKNDVSWIRQNLNK